MGKRKSVDRRRYEIALGYVFFEEFKSCGSVVEKLLYHDSSANGTAAGFVLLFLAAFDNVTSAEFISVLP